MQVVDQLGQVLNRVDVMVWRGRDECNPGFRRAQRGDVLRDLGAGQLPALSWLRPLGHLDLNLVWDVFGKGEVGIADLILQLSIYSSAKLEHDQ